MASSFEFHTDPAAFLEVAGAYLAADPVQGTVVISVAERAVRLRAEGYGPEDGRPEWYVVARDPGGGISGIGMRTAPFAPYPLLLLGFSTEDAAALAREVHARGEVAPANGALPGSRAFTDEMARLTDQQGRVLLHSRLFELGELVPPSKMPSGRLRLAREDDADLALAWFRDFVRAADEQAGRDSGHDGEHFTLEDTVQRIHERRLWFWDDGGPVHMTGANPPGYGVSRLGPVYTPAEHRGRGYASAAVAEISATIRAEGSRVCLFTDQANPVSNGIYEALGYRPVVDMANHVLVG